jgi:hypothetical protein
MVPSRGFLVLVLSLLPSRTVDAARTLEDMFSEKLTFKINPFRATCNTAFAGDATIRYSPPVGGLPETRLVPAASFSIRGVPCDVVNGSFVQLSSELLPGSNPIFTALWEGSTFDNVEYAYNGKLQDVAVENQNANHSQQCAESPVDGEPTRPSFTGTLKHFLVGKIRTNATVAVAQSEDPRESPFSFVPGTVYFVALLNIPPRIKEDTICIFEEAVAGVNDGGSSSANRAATATGSGHGSRLGGGAIAGITISTILFVVALTGVLVFCARRKVRQRGKDTGGLRRSNSADVQRARASQVYDNLDKIIADST